MISLVMVSWDGTEVDPSAFLTLPVGVNQPKSFAVTPEPLSPLAESL